MRYCSPGRRGRRRSRRRSGAHRHFLYHGPCPRGALRGHRPRQPETRQRGRAQPRATRTGSARRAAAARWRRSRASRGGPGGASSPAPPPRSRKNPCRRVLRTPARERRRHSATPRRRGVAHVEGRAGLLGPVSRPSSRRVHRASHGVRCARGRAVAVVAGHLDVERGLRLRSRHHGAVATTDRLPAPRGRPRPARAPTGTSGGTSEGHALQGTDVGVSSRRIRFASWSNCPIRPRECPRTQSIGRAPRRALGTFTLDLHRPRV